MDSFIIHTLSIKNHPICDLKEEFKSQYILGLGEFMCYLSTLDKRAKIVFEAWANSIMQVPLEAYWQYDEKCVRIKKAVSIKRDGFRFFSMRKMFLFDCLYLSSKLGQTILDQANSFLEKKTGLLSELALERIYTNWNSFQKLDVPNALKEHRKQDETFQSQSLARILVVATTSAGKSTLINALVGYPINEVATTACTNSLHYIYNKHAEDGIIIKNQKGIIHYQPTIEHQNNGEFGEAAVHFHSQLSDSRICFIDTPGINYARAKQHKAITYDAIKKNEYEALLFVSNSNYFDTDDEMELLRYVISHTRKPILFALNKVDTFKQGYDSIEKMIQDFENNLRRMKYKGKVVPISAEAALYSKIGADCLDPDELCLYNQYHKRFANDYYDLPSYYTGESSNDKFLDRTGITLLENIIESTIK